MMRWYRRARHGRVDSTALRVGSQNCARRSARAIRVGGRPLGRLGKTESSMQMRSRRFAMTTVERVRHILSARRRQIRLAEFGGVDRTKGAGDWSRRATVRRTCTAGDERPAREVKPSLIPRDECREGADAGSDVPACRGCRARDETVTHGFINGPVGHGLLIGRSPFRGHRTGSTERWMTIHRHVEPDQCSRLERANYCLGFVR